MLNIIISICFLTLIVVIFIKAFWKKKKIIIPQEGAIRDLLQNEVSFFQKLSDPDKELFLKRVIAFLETVKITGIRVVVEPLDSILVASSAIIPVFYFENFLYRNINEVLLYPDSFSKEFSQQGEDRNVLGMVGTGPLQNVMVLSKQSLRNGFNQINSATNTGIHEFIHLIDKTDGETDGLPEALVNQAYVLPWLNCIHNGIKDIQNGESDINPYGATNQAEFFAVAAEYFFNKPDSFKENHPKLYELFSHIFQSDK